MCVSPSPASSLSVLLFELLMTSQTTGDCVLCLVVHAGVGLASIVLLHQLSVSQKSQVLVCDVSAHAHARDFV